jgi:two-component system cell cycle sensor histidine kinase/response regulator CckA
MEGHGDPLQNDAPFRAVIEASPIPYALNDADGNIVYLNPEFVRTYGYTLADIPSLDAWWPRAYPDPEYRAQVAAGWSARLADAQRTGSPFEAMEVRIRAKDGALHTVVAYSRSLAPAMAGIQLVVLYDVTKERRLAEEQRILQEHLMESRRLESLGRLTGGIAHDFNNTLGVILGRVCLSLKLVAPGEETHAHLVEILEAAQHSAELIRQLLAYAKRQPAAPQIIDPNEIVESSMSVLRLLVGDVKLRWVPADDVGFVEIDPAQLDQILTNLCSNARDVTPAHGEVTIATENVTVSDDALAVSTGISPGEYVALAVSDQGEGVAPEIAARIFEPFFTTKVPDQDHHGLGLSTVYGIARQNRGGVLVEPARGRGATFKVLLPRAR